MTERPKDPRLSSSKNHSNKVNNDILRAAQQQKLVNSLYSQSGGGNKAGRKCKETNLLKLYYPMEDMQIDSVKPNACRSIIISCLPATTNEDHLRELFSSFGKINDIKLESMTDPSGKAARVCLLTFNYEKSINEAVSYNGYKLVIKRGGRSTSTPFPMDVGLLSIHYATSENLDLQQWRQEQLTLSQVVTNSKIPQFSENEVTKVLNFLRDPEKLVPSINIITEWMSGNFNNATSRIFFSLLTHSMSTFDSVVSSKLSVYKDLLKKNRQEEKKIQTKIIDILSSTDKLLEKCTLHKMAERFYYENQRTEIKDSVNKTNSVISDVRKELAGLNSVYNPSGSSDSSSSHNENIIALFQTENEQLKETVKKLKNESAEKSKSILAENANLVVQMAELQEKTKTMETELNKIKNELEKYKNDLINKEKEVSKISEERSALEKYVSLVSRERTKAKMFDEYLSKTTDNTCNNPNHNNLDNLNGLDNLDGASVFHIKEEDSLKRTAEQSSSLSSHDGHEAKKTKLDCVSLTNQELILVPVLAIFLRSLPYGASVQEIAKLLSDSNIQIDQTLILNIFKKLSTIFQLEALSTFSRWRLIVFDHFMK